MKLIRRLLDYSRDWQKPHMVLFTGNPVLKRNGAIVMGRGAAKQVRDTYEGIDQVFGAQIKAKPDASILWASLGPEKYIGWFKVKHHWQQPADLKLIQASCRELWKLATEHPEVTFHMNYPGIGNGKLDINSVAGMLDKLPDNVWVYQ
jgi:hypothetical protein